MPKYWVYTDSYERYSDPPEYGSDVEKVEAENPSKAKAIALRVLRGYSQPVKDRLLEKRSPFAVLHVELESYKEMPNNG